MDESIINRSFSLGKNELKAEYFIPEDFSAVSKMPLAQLLAKFRSQQA
jgi:hypothetical protein